MSECRSCTLEIAGLQAREHTPVDSQPMLLTRDFGLVWWSQVVSQVGDGVTKLALLWFVYSITGSALKTTVIGLLQTIPPILFGPLIGVYLDRLPKKPILIGMDLTRALLIGVIPCWIGIDAFTVDRLYVLVFLHSFAGAIFGPALTASVPALVPRTQFTAANALLQGTTSIGVIVGSALSGIGIAAFSSQEVLCVNAATYVLSALCLLPARFTGVHSQQLSRPASMSVLGDLMEGVRFAFVGQRTILLLIMTAALYSIGTSAFSTLFPVLGRKMLDLGPVEVGYLWSAFGIGLLAVSFGLMRLTAWTLHHRVLGIALASAINGVAVFSLLWISNRLWAAVLMTVIGAGIGVFTPIAWGILQELSPDHMVGRALTLYGTGAMAAAIAGMATFGWLTEQYGERASVIGIVLIMFATAAMAGGFSGWLRAQPSSLSPSRS
ncbi:MAG TPA: MFS transporter [Nitrospiraceae bacterium]|nr:MFS transporter [Nitrospiraceae bacterium]